MRVISGDDFVIEHMPNTHYFYTAGICSPGLTAAPAIAEYLVDEMAKDGLTFKPHEVVSRKPYVCTADMSKKALKELIKQNPAYGKIVCRCEKITEGEILDAINSPLHPTDVDAIKTVSKGIEMYKSTENAVLIITHNTRILSHLDVDYVHVLINGKIVKTGTAELAKEIDENGYTQFKNM